MKFKETLIKSTFPLSLSTPAHPPIFFLKEKKIEILIF